MRTILLLSMCMVLSHWCTAQCKQVKKETDKFSKKELRTAKMDIGSINFLTGGTKWLLQFNQEAGQTTLETSIAMRGEFNQVLDQSTQFLLLLANDEVVTLANEVPARPVTKVISGSGVVHVFTTYSLTLRPDKEQLSKMAAAPLSEVKVVVPDQKIISPSVSKKDGKAFAEVSACLLQTAL